MSASSAYDWYLRGALRGRKCVLDLGCGGMKGALYADPDAWYVGLDLDMIEPSDWPKPVRDRPGQSLYVASDLRKSGISAILGTRLEPDVVLLLDVVEHLHKDEGLGLLHKIRDTWPRARVVVYTPVGLVEQDFGPTHPMTHRSGWYPEDLPEWDITEDPGNVHPAFFARIDP